MGDKLGNRTLQIGGPGMKNFSVYVGPSGEYVAVKNGFSLAAAFLQWIWLAYKRMFLLSMVVFLAYILLGNLIYGMEEDANALEYGLRVFVPVLMHPPLIENEFLRVTVGILRTVLFGLVIGAFGNRWHKGHLAKNGFVHVIDVQASASKTAIESAHAFAANARQ